MIACLLEPATLAILGVEVEILRRRLSGGPALQNRFDEGAGVERSAARRNLERRLAIDDVDLEIVAGRDARLRDRGALHGAGWVHLSRSPEHRHAEVDGDVAERGAVRTGLDEERRLARFSSRLREPRDGIVDACRREVDFDLRVGAGQRRLEFDRKRPGQPRAEIDAAPGASGRVEGERYGRRPFLAGRAGDIHMGRGAEHLAVTRDLQRIAIGLERGRRRLRASRRRETSRSGDCRAPRWRGTVCPPGARSCPA